MKFILTLLILFALGSFLTPVITAAVECPPGSGEDNGLNLCYPNFGGFSLTSKMQIEQIVAWLYVFFVMISGLAAFIMIVWGGVKWMSSQGDPGQVGDARDKIKMALLGLLLVLASFLILQIINPELTLLEGPALSVSPGSSALPGTPSETVNNLPPGAPDGVYLCAKDTCEGQDDERQLATGSLGLVGSLGAWNDRATALAIKGSFDVLLYENSGGDGRVICFTDSVSDLEPYIIGPDSANGWDGDVSSLNMVAEGDCKIPGITFPTEATFTTQNINGVLLCWDTDCVGTEAKYFFVTDASLDNLGNVGRIGMRGNWNNKVAALKITDPLAILLYEHAGKNGKVICFSSPGIISLNIYGINPKNTWEDDVGSIELLGASECSNEREGNTFLNRAALMAVPP